MAPKRVTIIDADGIESNESVANDSEFKSLVDDYSIRYLVTDDSEKTRIRGFESLEDGGTYTRGPPIQQQQIDDAAKVDLSDIKLLADFAHSAKASSQFAQELVAAMNIMVTNLK